MFTLDYFGLGEEYFRGKRVLDAGCGDTAKLIIALARFGAAEIHGVEIGEDFISVANKNAEAHGIDTNIVQLKGGSVLELPYDDNYFDFVACHGVLVHLNSPAEILIGFSELARVTRPGGHLYVVFTIDGGLLEEAVFPGLRRHYVENDEFRALIDSIEPEDLWAVIDMAASVMEAQTGERPNIPALKQLVDVDLCVYFQNLLQAPTRWPVDKEFAEALFQAQRFVELRRLRRYVKRNNVRRFLAPLHYERDHPLSKILYGNGSLEYIARKDD